MSKKVSFTIRIALVAMSVMMLSGHNHGGCSGPNQVSWTQNTF